MVVPEMLGRAELARASVEPPPFFACTTLKERVLRVFEVKGDADALAVLVQKVFAAQNPGRHQFQRSRRGAERRDDPWCAPAWRDRGR